MKRIFLCSSFADVASILSKSVSVPLKGKTVAFIPTASIHEEYMQYVEDGRMALDSLGLIVNEIEITQCSKNKIKDVLYDCDCIYISGGNTFFLMQELRKTGTDKLIIEQIEKGKLYIGESAGAMILVPNIEYAKDMDDHLTQVLVLLSSILLYILIVSPLKKLHKKLFIRIVIFHWRSLRISKLLLL